MAYVSANVSDNVDAEVDDKDNYSYAALIFDRCIAAVSLAVLIYGITSWCLIKRFRHFKNYVFLQAILANFLRICMYCVILPVFIQPSITEFNNPAFIIYSILLYYFGSVQSYWLLVICYIFYVDIVKVFSDKIERRYLKSSIFSWGVPLLTTPFAIYLLPLLSLADDTIYYLRVFIVVIPIFINLIIYIVIVSTLFCSKANVGSATNNWRRFYIATVIFLFCDFIFLCVAILEIYSEIPSLLSSILSDVEVIVLDFFLIFLRSNRKLWREFYLKMKKREPTTSSSLMDNTTKL